MLDDAPVELVRLAGYLERMTAGLLLDLVTVSAFEIGGRRILVPQRIDPVQRVDDEPPPPRSTTRRAEAVPVEGSDPFAERIAACPEPVREAHHRLLRWARHLEQEGAARLWSTVGLTQDVLQVRVPGEQVGMVTLWRGDQGPAMSLWPTVFERRAPNAFIALQELIPPDALRKSLRDISEELLDVLTTAYREASAGA